MVGGMNGRGFKAMVAGAAVLALLALALPQRRADIRILTADQSDLNPHRMEAALDMGVFAVSLLVTWTSRIAR